MLAGSVSATLSGCTLFSSSDDEEDTKLKMLAAIAVSPDDLSTSNMVKKLGTR